MRSDVRVVPGPPVSHGAIAQLGERVLCKHEVVGSIPSGSTIFGTWARARSELLRSRPWGVSLAGRGSDNAMSLPPGARVEDPLVPPVPGCAKISNIVKRECGCGERESVLSLRSCSASIRRSGRKRSDRWSFCDRYRVALRASLTAVAQRRTSITGAIKCLKSIRWMPWR